MKRNGEYLRASCKKLGEIEQVGDLLCAKRTFDLS